MNFEAQTAVKGAICGAASGVTRGSVARMTCLKPDAADQLLSGWFEVAVGCKALLFGRFVVQDIHPNAGCFDRCIVERVAIVFKAANRFLVAYSDHTSGGL
jgi:hypothetical protein